MDPSQYVPLKYPTAVYRHSPEQSYCIDGENCPQPCQTSSWTRSKSQNNRQVSRTKSPSRTNCTVPSLISKKKIHDLRQCRTLDNSQCGVFLDVTLMILSIVLAGIYVYNTYVPEELLMTNLWFLELLCGFIFLFDYIGHRCMLADHLGSYLFSPESLVNVLVIFPVVPMSFFLTFHTLWFGNGYWRLLLPVRFFKCYFEIINVINHGHHVFTPVSQFALQTYVLILSVVLTAAGVIQIAETASVDDSTPDEWTFFSSFFYSILVFGTIGAPPADNTLSKVFVGILAIVLVIIVPYQISKVIEISSSYSKYEYATAPAQCANHIVVCGSLTTSRIAKFLNEIFHEDHDMTNIRVIFLCASEPTSTLRQILANPFYAKRVTFMHGSLLASKDAARAALGTAQALFILSRKHGQANLGISDHETYMLCMSAKRMAAHVPIFAQLHLSSSKQLLTSIGVEHIVCFSELMYGMFAQNCITPGFSTLVYNLTTSSDNVTGNSEWENQYLASMSQELYTVQCPKSGIVALSFAELSQRIYEDCNGVLCIAVLDAGRVLINPGASYICKGGETVFVIATDYKQAQLVTKMGFKKKKTFQAARSSQDLSWCEEGQGQNLWGLLTPELKKSTFLTSWEKDAARSSQVRRLLDASIVEDVRKLSLDQKPIIILTLSKTWAADLEYFMAPLRAPSVATHYPVVFASAVLPTPEEWDAIACYTDVHVIVGGFQEKFFLDKLGVDKAHRVVLLCGEGAGGSGDTTTETLVDCSTLALHRSLTLMMSTAQTPAVMVELIHRNNFGYISHVLQERGWFPEPNVKEEKICELTGFSKSPSFATGVVFAASLYDSLLINTFFNPFIIEIVHELMLASWKYQYPTILQQPRRSSLRSPPPIDTDPHSKKCSSLYACELPSHFIGQSFSYVLRTLLEADAILAIGIFRGVPDAIPSGANVPLGFVYVMPSPGEELLQHDLLYLLAPQQPQWATSPRRRASLLDFLME